MENPFLWYFVVVSIVRKISETDAEMDGILIGILSCFCLVMFAFTFEKQRGKWFWIAWILNFLFLRMADPRNYFIEREVAFFSGLTRNGLFPAKEKCGSGGAASLPLKKNVDWTLLCLVFFSEKCILEKCKFLHTVVFFKVRDFVGFGSKPR